MTFDPRSAGEKITTSLETNYSPLCDLLRSGVGVLGENLLGKTGMIPPGFDDDDSGGDGEDWTNLLLSPLLPDRLPKIWPG